MKFAAQNLLHHLLHRRQAAQLRLGRRAIGKVFLLRRALEMHPVDHETHVPIVVQRHAPAEVFGPAAGMVVGHAEHQVGHQDVRTAHERAAPAVARDAVIGFLARKVGHLAVETGIVETGGSVHEIEVDLVDAVLKLAEVVAAAVDPPRHHEPAAVEHRQMRKRRRLAFAEKGKHKAEILPGRVAANLDLVLEARDFRRLLHALTRGIEAPAVIEAAHRVALDPAHRKRSAAVRATRPEHLRATTLTTEKGEFLAHEGDQTGAAPRKFVRDEHRLPEHAQVATGQRAGTGTGKIGVATARRCGPG